MTGFKPGLAFFAFKASPNCEDWPCPYPTLMKSAHCW